MSGGDAGTPDTETPTGDTPRRAWPRRRVSVRFGPLLAVAVAWSYVLRPVSTGLPDDVNALLGVCAAVICLVTYRRDAVAVSLGPADAVVAGGLLLFGVVTRWNELFLSLGGDELYHAERATGFLGPLVGRAGSLPGGGLGGGPDGSLGAHREALGRSMWALFDPRHVPVRDLWQAVVTTPALLALCSAPFLLTRWRAAGKGGRVAALAVAAACLLALGHVSRGAPESHPPLRLMPLGLSAAVFGLSDAAFRLPGVAAATAAGWAWWRLAERLRPSRANTAAALAAVSIPVVHYAAGTVEPSVWGYLAYTAVLVSCLSWERNGDRSLVTAAAVAAGLGVLCRQSTVVLWAPVAVLAAASGAARDPVRLFKVALPGLLTLPYFLTVRRLGHTATHADHGPAWDLLTRSFTSGVGPVAVLNSTTLPWAAFAVVAFAAAVTYAPGRRSAVFLVAVPAYAVFHVVWPYLWGMGRYQAEYVAPFVSAAVVLTLAYAPSPARAFVVLGVPVLVAVTLETARNLSYDTDYAEWPRMRVTTSAHFPYREAIGALHREDKGGSFALLGGSPVYGPMAGWLAGLSPAESVRWGENQSKTEAAAAAGAGAARLAEVAAAAGVTDLLVQGGTRREAQHRSPASTALFAELEKGSPAARRAFERLTVYESPHGGTITRFRVRARAAASGAPG